MNCVEFGSRVKMFRKKNKLTQAQLAAAIGKKEVTIRKYENGTIEAPWNVIEELAAALSVSPFDLTLDADALRNEVKLIEQISTAYGTDSVELLNDYISLNEIGKEKVRDYVSDLAHIPEYTQK